MYTHPSTSERMAFSETYDPWKDGRKARLIEIDPKYADCIVRRYQEYTGKQATLVGDGRTFDEIVQERQKEVA